MVMQDIDFNIIDILDIGNKFEISGVVYSDGNGEGMTIMLPDEGDIPDNVMFPTKEQWETIVRQSDLKEVKLVGDVKDKKIILRKSTRNIETKIMWEVFRRDHFTCRYCAENQVPMTVDHVVLWEEMGPSIVDNLICSCKKCNNARGNMQYEDWLMSDYYLTRAVKLDPVILFKNSQVILQIPNIRANHMRVSKRNR